jgi:signal transduction histidine kinase
MLFLHGKDIGMFRYLWLASLLLLGTLIKGENTDNLSISTEKAVTGKGEIQALIDLSRYWTSKNSDSAIYYSQKLQQVALKAQHYEGYFRGCYNLVSALYETDRRENALVQGQKAIAYFDKKEHKAYKVKLLVLIAEKSRQFGHYDAAIRYFGEAAHCGDISDMDTMESYIFSRMAAVYFELDKYQLTEAYIDSSQRVLKPGRSERISISNLEIMGALQRKQGHYQNAIGYFQDALKKITDESFILIEANLYSNLAKTYLAMNDFPNALSYAVKSNEAAGKAQNIILLESAAECLAKAYAGTGNYTQAYQYLEIKENLKWQRYGEAHDKLIAEKNARYESGKKEARIADQIYLIGQEKRENNFLLAGIILAVLILMYVVFTQLKLKKVNRLLMLKNEEINRQTGELEIRNQKLHKLSDFKEAMTGMVIHDLKNPLNTLINLEHIEKNPDKAKVIIEKNGRAMLNMVMNILDVYKYENAGLKITEEAIFINKIATEACNDVRLLAREKNLNIQIIANSNYTILADSELMQRVISNLLANAIKFSKTSENIDITISEAEPGWLKVEVTDKGEGIDQKILPVIFDKFAQAEKKKSGLAGSTGLGLTFCKMVIEAHGGNIGATSEKGSGSVFWFTLPFANKTQSADLSAEKQHIPGKTKKLQLSKTALEELAPFLSKLRTLEVYAVSEIHACLKTIPVSENADIQLWKDEVSQAVNTMNGKYYQSLTNQ